jgi:hypothetical protein
LFLAYLDIYSRLRDKVVSDGKVLYAYTRFNGIPRRCFRAVLFDGEKLEDSRIEHAIVNISSFEQFVNAASGSMSFKESTSHAIVRIEPTNDSWTEHHTELLSNAVSDLVFQHIRVSEQSSLRQSIDRLLLNPNSRGYGGKMFEQAVHRRYRQGITLTPEAMSASARALHFEILPTNDPAFGYFNTLSVGEKIYSRKVSGNYLCQYLIPLSSTAETIDAVYISTAVTVFFQITAAQTHPLNLNGITELVDELPHNAKQSVCIVFVVPDSVKKPYQRQRIVVPPETTDEIREKVVGYHQYVIYTATDMLFPL